MEHWDERSYKVGLGDLTSDLDWDILEELSGEETSKE